MQGKQLDRPQQVDVVHKVVLVEAGCSEGGTSSTACLLRLLLLHVVLAFLVLLAVLVFLVLHTVATAGTDAFSEQT